MVNLVYIALNSFIHYLHMYLFTCSFMLFTFDFYIVLTLLLKRVLKLYASFKT